MELYGIEKEMIFFQFFNFKFQTKISISCLLQLFFRNKNEPLMPAEVAFARFSLSEGVKETFHALLDLTPLPMMYTYSAKAHAEKTHHIPPRAGLGENWANTTSTQAVFLSLLLTPSRRNSLFGKI